MRIARSLLIFAVFCLYFTRSLAINGLLPISLSNTVNYSDNLPSVTLIVQDTENQRVQPFYFILYEGSNEVMSFFGQQYRVLSSQFQAKDMIINNFCGLQGKKIMGQSLEIQLFTTANPGTPISAKQLHCHITAERFH